jgi:lysophospholipase
MLFCLCFFTAFLNSSALAIEESQLATKFQAEIMPYFETGKSGTLTGKDGVPIAWKVFPSSTSATRDLRALVIFNGRSEFMRKYAELVYDLKNSGYTLYLMDNRGQGESGRMTKESQLGYVRKFHDYVDDIETFMNQVVLKDNPSEIHLLAHSMGATAATIYDIEHPGTFRSMVLSGPMYQPNLGKYSECEALAIGELMKLIGRSENVAPGRTLDEWKGSFETNNVTHSPARYGYAQDLLNARPEIAIGGPSYQWVLQAILGGKWVRENAMGFVTPVRILQAGEEKVVVSSFQNEVCGKAKNCEIQLLEGAKHEMLMEADQHRNRAIQLALDWFSQHSRASHQ